MYEEIFSLTNSLKYLRWIRFFFFLYIYRRVAARDKRDVCTVLEVTQSRSNLISLRSLVLSRRSITRNRNRLTAYPSGVALFAQTYHSPATSNPKQAVLQCICISTQRNRDYSVTALLSHARHCIRDTWLWTLHLYLNRVTSNIIIIQNATYTSLFLSCACHR